MNPGLTRSTAGGSTTMGSSSSCSRCAMTSIEKPPSSGRGWCHWCAFNNPSAAEEPTYFVLEDKDGLLAHIGRMPLDFLIGGKQRRAYFAHDLFVHPRAVASGMGFFHTMRLFRELERRSPPSFVHGSWATDLNMSMQRLRRWHEQLATRYVRILNPRHKLRELMGHEGLAQAASRVARGVLATADSAWLGIRSRETRVSLVTAVDERFDALMERVGQAIDATPVKGSAYLNWKYIARPFSRKVFFAAERDGQLQGWIVCAMRRSREGRLEREGTIVDLLALPDDRPTLCALILRAIRYFHDRRADTVDCLATSPKLAETLRSMLFLKRNPPAVVVMFNLDKIRPDDEVGEIARWNFHYGEGDAFMLDPFN